MERSDKAKKVTIASGVVAIVAAIIAIQGFIHTLALHIEWGINISIFFLLGIDPIVTVLSMVLCAVYVFAFYGKKKSPLLGISVMLLAALHALTCISLVSTMNFLYPDFRSYFLFLIVTGILNAIIFVLMAIKFFSMKPGVSINIFPVVAIIIAMTSSIVPMVILEIVSFSIFTLISRWLYIVPFLLIALLSPTAKAELIDNASPYRMQEQEVVNGDINAQLHYLKKEFDSGRISIQEYDYRRKILIDML